MLQEIRRYEQRLDSLFNKSSFFASDAELLSHWSRYLCVLVSGYIEISIYEILTERVQNKSSPDIARFVTNSLENFQNPKMEKIKTLMLSFNPEWQKSIESHPQFSEMAAAVNSVVAQRNQIAHGESSSLTIHAMKDYYVIVRKFIEHLEQVILT
jgi:hypothetical protein